MEVEYTSRVRLKDNTAAVGRKDGCVVNKWIGCKATEYSPLRVHQPEIRAAAYCAYLSNGNCAFIGRQCWPCRASFERFAQFLQDVPRTIYPCELPEVATTGLWPERQRSARHRRFWRHNDANAVGNWKGIASERQLSRFKALRIERPLPPEE